jgi:ADP-glucose pyrophosphorylase
MCRRIFSIITGKTSERFALLSGNLDLASPLPKFDFFNDADPIYTRSRYLPPSKIHAATLIIR